MIPSRASAVEMRIADADSRPPWWLSADGQECPPHTSQILNVNGRLARLSNRRQGIARALFLFDPLLFVTDDV